MTYGSALRMILRQSGMTQAELARAIGRSTSYVSQLMTGKVREPSISTAFEIADALHTTVQAFLDLMHSDGDGNGRALADALRLW